MSLPIPPETPPDFSDHLELINDLGLPPQLIIDENYENYEDDENYYVFKLQNNKRAYVLKEELESIFFEETFFGGLIRSYQTLDKEIFLWEDYGTFMSIIDSVRLNTLIVYEGVNMDYMLALCDKWCITGQIIDKLKNRLGQNTNILMGYKELVSTFECRNCGKGFSTYENTNDSCVYYKNNTEIRGKHIMHESARDSVISKTHYLPKEIINLLTT